MVVDSSALVAIFLLEPDAPALTRTIATASRAHISAANLVETLIVLTSKTRRDVRGDVSDLLGRSEVEVSPVTAAQAWLAGEAFRRFGKGRHPAALNLGDCFAYALAKDMDLPLLFKGDDLAKTDIRPALL